MRAMFRPQKKIPARKAIDARREVVAHIISVAITLSPLHVKHRNYVGTQYEICFQVHAVNR